MKGKKWLILSGIWLAGLFIVLGLVTRESFAAGGSYKILTWNDLGMHCYSRDFADMAVLPPYNTLWVQVLKAGDPPEVVTSGITVEYFYADNTYSVGKTNFWAYDQALFGVNLPANVGLKGKGLSGTMDLSGDHFIAEGIPITEFSDSAPTVRQPYQLATVVVKDSTTNAVLASIQVVTPTSSEMRCDNCHSDTGIAKPSTPTGKVETNILQLHDENSGTTLMASRPVLCASCHGSNALGAPGQPGIKSLSKSMHQQHASIVPSTLDGCYNCHPGPQTRCLRDVMSTEEGMTCVSCHGGLGHVSSNPNPWLTEPRCDSCHNSGQFNQDQALYRFSKGHGGLYCESCHDSTHAIAPSREANDAIKFTQLQGSNGPIQDCSVCHTLQPSSGGPHQPNTTRLITGTVGRGGVSLSYKDVTVKTVTSQADGSYSISIPAGWSGTVTPSLPCYAFDPPSYSYSNVTVNQSLQSYTMTVDLAAGCTGINVKIGTNPSWEYMLASHTSTRTNYPSQNSGPVHVTGANAGLLMISERVLFGGKSYSEMMGLPVEQLSQEYWFPSYNNVDLNSQLRVGNLGNTSTIIKVYLGTTQIDSYTLAAGAATRKNYAYNGGPLRVTSSATKILSTIRLLYNNQSFSELMGLPKEQLTTSYLFPYYNNVAMTSNLQVSNVGTVATTIKVYLGSSTTPIDTFSLPAKSTTSKIYANQNSGPLKVTSSAANIVPSIRVLYAGQSYSEMIGYPGNQLTNEFWYPVYDNLHLNSQLRVSNVGTGPTTITVYAGTTQIANYTLGAGKATRYNYAYNTGPLHVVSSNQPILSTVRELYTTPGFQSFYELMGMPKMQLSTQYYFPWYNNVAMSSELRLAVP